VATVTRLVTTPDSGNTPNSTGSFTPQQGDLLVVVLVASASLTNNTEVPSVSANGITFATTGHQRTYYNAGTNTLDVFVADQLVGASPTAMTVTWNPADTATSTVIDVYAVRGGAGLAGTAAVLQRAGTANQSSGGTPSVVFSGACKTTSVTIVATGNLSAPAGLTPPSGWTEVNDTNCTTPTAGLEVAARTSGFTGTTVTWGSTSATAYGTAGVEIATVVTVTATAASAWDVEPSIGYLSAGSAATGSTTVDVPYPSTLAAGAALFLAAVWKDETCTVPTLSGWTVVHDQIHGEGTDGDATGQVRGVVWSKDTVSGSESGSVTVTPVGGSNVVVGAMVAYSVAAGLVWEAQVDYGNDTTYGTSVQVSGLGPYDLATQDVLLALLFLTSDTALVAAPTFTSGDNSTSNSATAFRANTGTATGNNARLSIVESQVTAGTDPSVNFAIVGTTAASTSGGGAFLVVRAVASTTTPVTQSVASAWKITGSVTQTAAAAWHVKAALSSPATRASAWDVLTALTPSTRAAAWHVKAAVAASTRASAWHVNATLAPQTTSAAWDVLATLTPATRGSAWRVLATTSPATRASAWAVDAQVEQTRAAAWHVEQGVTSVTQSAAAAWDVLTTLTPQTAAAAWDVLVAVPQAAPSAWRVLADTTPATRAAAWRVLAQAPQSADSAWAIVAQITATADSAWTVESPVGQVTQTQTAAWHVGARITATAAAAWHITTPWLAVPTSLTAVAVSRTQINLTWDTVTYATGYDLERNGSVVLTAHPTASYSDTGLDAGTTYNYRVRAVVPDTYPSSSTYPSATLYPTP
jgi:hypothetical protein